MASKFERLSDEQFKKYMNYFNKITPDQQWADLDDFYQGIMYDNTLSTKIGSPVGINPISRLDIEYLYYFIETGERPELTSIEVNWITEEKTRTRYTRSEDIDTYAPNAIDPSYLGTLNGDDEIDPWSWDVSDSDEYDSDVISDWFEV